MSYTDVPVIQVAINTSVVPRWVERCARQVANEYNDDYFDLEDTVDSVVDRFIASPEEALTIIAAYGYEEGLTGCDPEDSPISVFEDYVRDKARELIEDERRTLHDYIDRQ
jgi:hypothetical protein